MFVAVGDNGTIYTIDFTSAVNSTVTISTPTTTTSGASPSSITYNNVQQATNRAQLQITGTPTISSGVYTWPVSVITNSGVIPTASILDCQTVLQGAVTEITATEGSSTVTGTNYALRTSAGVDIASGSAWTTVGQIQFIPANFGSAQTTLQALTTGNYIFVQGTTSTASSMTVLFSSAGNATQQALDICTAFNTTEVAYTASCNANVVTLTSSAQTNLADISHGAVSSGTNGTNVLADYTLAKTQDGRGPYTVGSGTRDVVTLTKAGNIGAGTRTVTLDYGAPAVGSNPSGLTSVQSAINTALNNLSTTTHE